MTRISFLLLLLLSACTDRPVKPEEPPAAPSENPGNVFADAIARCMLPGHTMLDTLSGDLNLDSRPDLLLILRKDGEDTTYDPPAPRPLLLLTGRPDGSLQLAARNDHIVLCATCGGPMGDPYQQMAISKGYFSVEHYGGAAERWTYIITFRYHPEDAHWYLHKEGGSSFDAIAEDEDEDEEVKEVEKVRTVKDFGKVRFEDYKPRD